MKGEGRGNKEKVRGRKEEGRGNNKREEGKISN
jgi:hypothetical protein